MKTFVIGGINLLEKFMEWERIGEKLEMRGEEGDVSINRNV